MSLATRVTTSRGFTAVTAPVLFVIMWSSGFVGAAYGLPHAEPATFLAIRLAVAILLGLAIALAQRAPWPRDPVAIAHIVVAGLLIHGIYLGGVFAAIHAGMPTGIVALIVSAQPLLTALLVGPLLGERITAAQWLGLAIGFAGVGLVVARSLHFDQAGLAAVFWVIAALVAITLGTIYQKRFCADLDLRTGVVIQWGAAGLAALAASCLFESQHVEWVPEFVFAILWLAVVLSLGATFLFYFLLRRGAASRVASLFYLVPPTTAVMAWAAFDERLGALALFGMALTVIGVALVNR